MKNFFKKLSFVLAIAMVLTTVVPATASAAGKNYMELNGKKVTTVTAWIGGVTRNLDYNVGGKTSGVKGSWKVGNTSVATINAYGVVTPVANGTTKVRFTPADGSGAVTITLKVRTRAAALHVYDPTEYEAGTKNKLEGTTVELNAGDSKTLKVTMPISKKAVAANGVAATYFLYATSSDESVVTATAGANNRSVVLKGLAAGEATVTLLANQTTLANVKSNKYYQEASFTVKVSGESKIASAEATKVNVVTVKFNGAAAEDTVLALAKGTNAVENTVAWNADRTEATLTTTAKMTNGTYTVTATVADAKSEATFEVVSQYVKEIKILNDVALTGKKAALEAGEAYIYYAVYDQYGEDLTASTSITWSASADIDTNNRAEGKLTVSRSDGKDFTYGEQVFVTGVYTKTGVNVQATLNIGTKQALNSIDVAGFVKKNTSELVQTLPAGFKGGEYYLVFDAVDQNGNALSANSDYVDGTEATFVTDNVLVVYEIKGDGKVDSIVVNGHEYNAVAVTPGQYVDKGGEFNVTAIATKTGNKVTKNFVVGQNQILTSFTMDAPSGVIADGERWEIPFTALDQNGEKITNFGTIANNLNKITFTVSDAGNGASVVLAQNDDGTASLVYNDRAIAWNNTYATDGIDRTVSVTSVVLGGNSDNLMMYISDKARPDAISDDALAAAYLEGDSYRVGKYVNAAGSTVRTFTFLDQYGRKMTAGFNNYWSNDTAYNFFTASKNGGVAGTDFSKYEFDVVYEFKGAADVAFVGGQDLATLKKGIVGLRNGATTTFNFGTETLSVESGNVIAYTIAKAEIAKNALVDEYESVSTTKNKSFALVDLTQVKNFAVADVNMIGIETDASDYSTLSEFMTVNANTLEGIAALASTTTVNTVYVSVTGQYNGVTVNVPANYFKVLGTAVGTASDDYNDYTVNTVKAGTITWGNLYDAKSANFARKNMSTGIKVVVAQAYANEEVTSGAAILFSVGDELDSTNKDASIRDTVTKAVTVSDARATLAKVVVPETYTFNPTNTEMTGADILGFNSIYYAPANYYQAILYDQYGNDVTPFGYGIVHNVNTATLSYKVSNIKEAAGYADNNFTVANNDSATLSISGAEIGDTFTLTVTGAYNGTVLSKDIVITVGADVNANITNATNNYTDTLIKNYLEVQRAATLK